MGKLAGTAFRGHDRAASDGRTGSGSPNAWRCTGQLRAPAISHDDGMITLEDCIGFCGLTEEEVLAIAEHEHLPEIAATALAQYLLSQEHGSERVRDMIVDDIRRAQVVRDNKEKVLMLLHVLHHFLKTHPEATPPNHPWSKRF
jgi:hypothetical protein